MVDPGKAILVEEEELDLVRGRGKKDDAPFPAVRMRSNFAHVTDDIHISEI